MIVKRFFKGIFAINVIFIISAMSVSLYSCQNEDVANGDNGKCVFEIKPQSNLEGKILDALNKGQIPRDRPNLIP